MADGDKLVTLDGLKEVYLHVNRNIGDVKAALNSVADIPENICFVTNGASGSRGGVSWRKAEGSNDTVEIYGVCSAIANFNPFNGNNESGTNSWTPTKYLSPGKYTVYYTRSNSKIDVFMTDANCSSRTSLTSGSTITVGENGACILIHYTTGNDFGTSENPSTLTLKIYSGENISDNPSAVDDDARSRVEECEGAISIVNGRIDDCEIEIENTDARVGHVETSVFYNFVPNINWVIGGIVSNGTVNSTYKYCIRPYGSASQFPVNGVISCDEGYEIKLVRYSDSLLGSGNFISTTSWTSAPQAVLANEWIAVCVRNANDTSTVLEDTSISSHVHYDFKTPCYLPYQRSPYYRNISAYPSDFSGWYETNQTFTEGFNENTMYADVIAAFDTLVSESGGYLTKADIGTITSVDGQGNAYHIYEYTFTPKRYSGSYLKKTAPTILLECSAHGFEKNSTYAVYYFLKDVLKNWSEDNILASIRRGVTLKIVPVSNPWGFDHNDRLNENGVNLNRNYWNPNWEPNEQGTSNYGGTEPFSEIEAQVIRDWILANKNAFAVINVHTNGQYNSVGYPEANALMPVKGVDDPYYNMIYDACRSIINDQTIRLPDEIVALSNIPYNKMIGKIQDGGITETSGTLPKWVVLQGILAMTLEVFNGLNEAEGVSLITRFSADSSKAVTEIFGNGLAKILKEYAGK